VREVRSAVLALSLAAMIPTATQGATLTAFFPDVAGDAEGAVDLVGATLRFDNATGEYQIVVEAAPESPFSGEFNLNFNLFNASLGTTEPDPSFFGDTLNNFDLTTPREQVILTGTNDILLEWTVGDEVFVHNFCGTGDCPSQTGVDTVNAPDNAVQYRSGLLGFGGEDNLMMQDPMLGADDRSQLLTPEPSTIILLGSVFAARAGWRRCV